MQLLDILVCNLANKPSLHFFHLRSVGKKALFWISKRWYITGKNVQKLPIFAIFPHKYQVTLNIVACDSVWEGARHGDCGSFRFQMSDKKMPDGDYVPLYF